MPLSELRTLTFKPKTEIKLLHELFETGILTYRNWVSELRFQGTL